MRLTLLPLHRQMAYDISRYRWWWWRQAGSSSSRVMCVQICCIHNVNNISISARSCELRESKQQQQHKNYARQQTHPIMMVMVVVMVEMVGRYRLKENWISLMNVMLPIEFISRRLVAQMRIMPWHVLFPFETFFSAVCFWLAAFWVGFRERKKNFRFDFWLFWNRRIGLGQG